MKPLRYFYLGTIGLLPLLPAAAWGEILALVNYESKAEQTVRREGIAIIDVDPESEAFGTILWDMPLPPNLLAHHIFYNKDATKAYVTALGQSKLRVIDLTRNPYRMKTVAVPNCQVGEDVIFSDDNETWYLTCMGSSNVIVGDAISDQPVSEIALPMPYPHGIALHEGIDRMLVTSTVRASDLGEPGETVTVIEASTGRVLASHKLSNKPSPSGEAPVEILFVPGAEPPAAYVTNLFGATLWMGVWDEAKQDFAFRQVFDCGAMGGGVPLEMYFNDKRDRLYLTTANPGQFHIFDISGGPGSPELLKSIATAGGAHHVAITRDEGLAFVQNSLLNLPGMSDGSITVIDLEKGEVIASIDTFKDQGLNPNLIVHLHEWYNEAGH